MRTDKDIQKDIDEVINMQKQARVQVAFHKKAAVDAESELIHANIQFQNLKEELRVYYVKYPPPEECPYEEEIKRFRQKLPELLKKIK